MTRIGLAIDQPASHTPDWHTNALLQEFAARDMPVVTFRLADAAFATTSPHGLVIPGFDGALPGAVLVRAISGGSFEEVTRRLGVLHALCTLGVPVWNEAQAIERCVDKSTTSFLLGHAGIATPDTWAVEGQAAALAIAMRMCPTGPLVLKPLFGSQGKGLLLVTSEADLPSPEAVGGIYYLQRYLPPGAQGFRDHRLFVCGGKVVAAMTRQSDTWITNVRLGGTPLELSPDAELVDLAVRAAACVGAAYAGVDVLQDRHGRYWVLEVNSMPGWKGLQTVTSTSIAAHIVAAFLAAQP